MESEAQTFQAFQDSIKKWNQPLFDSIVDEINAEKGLKERSDTIPVFDVNDPSILVGLVVEDVYTKDDSILRKVKVRAPNRPDQVFYYHNNLLIKTEIYIAGGATNYYFPEWVHQNYVGLKYRLQLLYPESEAYWNSFSLGRLYLKDN